MSGRSLRSAGWRRWLVGLLAAAVFAAVVAEGWAYLIGAASAGSAGRSVAASVNQATGLSLGVGAVTPTANPNVPIKWNTTTLSNGVAVGGYVVNRYNGSNTLQSTGASCSGTVAATSCTENGVPDGTWKYGVQATLQNWVGPESSQITVKVDTSAPTIGAKPANPSNNASPSFSFSHGSYSSFACRLDAAASFTTCSTPDAVGPLADGSHTFRVVALDANGVATQIATYTWTVDTLAPTISREVVADATANTAGFIKQNTTYYAYAQVSDSGSGLATVTADLHTTTTGASAVAMSTIGGPWSIGGSSYNYRSAIQTASNPLSEAGNPYGFSITATDVATNNANASSTVNADNSGPSGGSVDATGLVGTSSRYSTSTTLHVAFAAGSDGAGVGLAASGFLLQRASTTLSSSGGLADGVCGAYGSFSTVATDPTSAFTDSTGITSGNCYRYQYIVRDKLGNTTTYTSGDIKVDTSAPSAPAITLSAATGNTFINGTTVYINPQGSNSGSFSASATTSDTQSGIMKVNFPSLGGFSSGGGDDTTSPYSSGTYNWTGSVAASGSQTVTATNNASGTATASFTVAPDTANPINGALSVNGTAATTGGSASSATNSTNFAITSRTDYTDALSGIATSTLTVQSETLTGATCGAPGSGGPFTTPTTITGTTQPAGILAGFCYVYTLTGTDHVGNTTSISTTVVDNALSFTVTAQPTSVTAGVATSGTAVKITAIKNGQTDTGYTGTLSWSGANNSPSGAAPSLPTSPTWTNGVATFGITLVKAEVETLSATDGTRTAGFAAITISPAAASKIAFVNCSMPSANTGCTGQPIAMGNNSSMTFNLQTQDSLGNPSAPTGTLTMSITGDTNFTIGSGSPATITPPASTSGLITLNHNNTNTTATITAHVTSGPSIPDATMTVKK